MYVLRKYILYGGRQFSDSCVWFNRTPEYRDQKFEGGGGVVAFSWILLHLGLSNLRSYLI